MSGHVTNANYSVKKLQFILFINREFFCVGIIDWPQGVPVTVGHLHRLMCPKIVF